MGRKPSRNKNLPQGMRARHRTSGTYYYLDTSGTPRREIALGSDYALAVKKWAELTVNAQPRHTELITFRYAAERYQREILPQKALRTQQDNLKELAKLYEFFDTPPAPLNKIEPIHIRQYLDWRVQDTLKRLRKDGKNVMGTEGRERANREKALFSHIWTLHVSGASLQSLIPVQAYAATKRLDEIPILMTRPIRQSLQLRIFQHDRQWNSLINQVSAPPMYLSSCKRIFRTDTFAWYKTKRTNGCGLRLKVNSLNLLNNLSKNLHPLERCNL